MQDVLNLTNSKKDLEGITSGRETDHFIESLIYIDGKRLLTMDASEKFIFTHIDQDSSVYVYRFENQKILRDPYFVYEDILEHITVVHLWIKEGVNKFLIIGGCGGVKIFSIEGLENDAPLSQEHIVDIKDFDTDWLCVSDSPAGKFLAKGDYNGETRIWYFNEWETFYNAQEKCQY
jgi:hypothetical protein